MKVYWGYVLLSVWVCVWSLSSGVEAKSITRKERKEQTERLLVALEKKQYDVVMHQMLPTLQRQLTVEQLGAYVERIFALTGAYKRGSLRLLSQSTEGIHERFVWHAEFAKDAASVLILFDQQSLRIGGLMIQSPHLQRQLHREIVRPLPQGVERQRTEAAISRLFEGYNQADWQRFSEPCGEAMRLAFRPPHFAFFQRSLMGRFGRFLSRRLQSAHTLQPDGRLILRYEADFEKKKKAKLQIILQKEGERMQILWWQIREPEGKGKREG